jgi:predicted nucleic acid-binding protein
MPNYAKFKPHFAALNIGGQHFDSMDQRDSQAMFPDAQEGGWDQESKQRDIWAEEILELLKKHYPSQSVEDKQKRADCLEHFLGTRSWTKVESMPSDSLKVAFASIKKALEPEAEAA